MRANTRRPASRPFPKPSRRTFIKSAAAGAIGAALAASSRRVFAIGTPQQPPNILWIMSDEHNHLVTGCYGSKIANTPNIDALAANGITFDNCYCNSPLCVPSRASLTAGKYVSRVSVWNNESELPSADIPSLPRVLNAAGYQSYLCGKQHYDYSRRYGFTEVGGNFNKNYKTGKGTRRRADDLKQKRLSARFDEFHTGDNGSSVNHDRRVTVGALDFLRKREAGEKPFFLYTGYLCPHFPLIVPEENYKHFEGKVGLPNIPPGHLDSLPLNYKHLRASFGVIGAPDSTVKKGRELYHGLTEWVDNEVGKCVEALRSNKAIADNTLIIYASDHGENMGEHGMWWKSDMYEHASHIPLVVSYPQRWTGGQRRSGVCSLLDLVKTVADFGGGHTPDDWNGDSMLAYMDDGKSSWKDYAVSEYYAHNVASGYVMARRGQWKYTYHTTMDKDHPAQRELFDLSTDPGEFTNIADKPENADRIKQMHAQMIKEVGGDPEETEQRCRHEIFKGYDRKDAPPTGGKKAKGEE